MSDDNEYLCAKTNLDVDLLASPTECDFDGVAIVNVIEDVWALFVEVDRGHEFVEAVNALLETMHEEIDIFLAAMVRVDGVVWGPRLHTTHQASAATQDSFAAGRAGAETASLPVS